MQLNKFWLIVLGLGLLFLILNRTNALDLLPGLKKKEEEPVLVQRDYLNEAMFHNLRNQYDIGFNQM